jgi:hypothetical protein
VLYVDDIFLARSDKNMLYETKIFLSANFDMKDLGDASYVLGIEIHRYRTKDILGLSQKSYIDRVLNKYNMHKCSAMPAPVVKGDKLGIFQCPKNKYEYDRMKSIPYASVVKSLMHAQVCTRPDIAFITGLLGRFQTNLRLKHWEAIKKALHYLQGTKHIMLTYRKSDELKFVGYADTDFVGGDSRKSTSGYIFTLAGGSISWKSSKQTITASLTMRAEFLSCYMAVRQTILLKKFVPGLRVVDNILKPLTLYCDNKSAVFFSGNNKSSDASKHIDIKYFVMKDRV